MLQVNPKTELLALKRGCINNGYKPLTIYQATVILTRLESSKIRRHVDKELDKIEKRICNEYTIHKQ